MGAPPMPSFMTLMAPSIRPANGVAELATNGAGEAVEAPW